MTQSVLDHRTNYLEANKDWADFVEHMSQRSGDAYGELWIRNARENKGFLKDFGWITEEQDSHEGKTAVICGASPSIEKQYDALRGISADKDFVFTGLTSGIKRLIENGIRPKYCMMVDGQVQQERFWEGLDLNQTRDTTLVASICAPPELLKKWRGPVKFIAVMSGYKDSEKKFRRWFDPVNGCGLFFHALFSQYNTAAAISYLVFGMRVFIFVGNELSFPSEEAPYYAGRKDPKDSWKRGKHPDIHGQVVYTNYMFFSLKVCLEDYLGKLPGWYFNCTESGIFGVSARYGSVPWIHQMKLSHGIAQARSIMKTGQPIYL